MGVNDKLAATGYEGASAVQVFADNAPKRRFSLTIDLQADDLDELIEALDDMSMHLRNVADDGSGAYWVTGAPRHGGQIRLHEDPSMSHDRYVAESLLWLQAQRASRPRS